jgi:glycosyltransferase involved in cell wall biosynthesis
VVVPAYNEAAVLSEFYRRTKAVLSDIGAPFEIVFVNDGSKDNTLSVIQELRQSDPRVVLVDLSRNFGKEIALSAGIDHASGAVVVLIDADLQDPPELIPKFIEAWREGHDVVYAVRTARDGETWLKKATANIFYRVIRSVSRIDIPRDTGDFRLMSRRAVSALCKLREQHRFMKGLFAWIGYPAKPIYYRRDPRHAGETSFNYFKLWNLAIEGLTSFTIAPLKVATYTGLLVAIAAFVRMAFVIYKTVRYGDPVQGYPSLMVVILFLGGVQLMSIGVLGEYVGRIFNEVKKRPLYLTKEVSPSVLNNLNSDESGNAPFAAGRSTL